MKRVILLSAIVLVAFLSNSCVTKKNYLELESKLKKTTEELDLTRSEKMDYKNSNKRLESQIENIKTEVDQLRKDTLSLVKKLNESERLLAKSKLDYDQLLESFTNANAANNQQVNKLLQNLDSIKTSLELKEKEINEKEAKLAELQQILAQKDAEVLALKEKVQNALQGFVDDGLNIYEKNGKVYVSMDEKLLFASGSWQVSKNGLNAIEELAKVLALDNEINVIVEGHTDNVQYRGSGQVKDNWDLSVMRATAVLKAILNNDQIEPQRITAAGRGEFVPIAPNETKEDKAKNRRTEIILTPKLDELFNIIENN